jgi:hypothetical protein
MSELKLVVWQAYTCTARCVSVCRPYLEGLELLDGALFFPLRCLWDLLAPSVSIISSIISSCRTADTSSVPARVGQGVLQE